MAAPLFFDTSPKDGESYPKGRFINGHFNGERLIECDPANIPAVLDWLDTFPNCLWPYKFGGWSQSAMLTAADIRPKPRSRVTSNDPQLIDFEKAWIWLTYSTDQMVNVAGIPVWEEIDPGLRPVPFSRSGVLRWASDSVPIQPGDVYIHSLIPAGTYRLNRYKLIAAPGILPYVWGRTNMNAYSTATLGYTFGPDCLLCTGAHVQRGSPGAASRQWKQANYTFMIHQEGWSKVLRPLTNQFEQILLPDGSPYLSQPRLDFNYITLGL